jgi:hypothetical protein
MPKMWDPIPSDSGCSRRDHKAASALLVLSNHAMLLEKIAEEMVSGFEEIAKRAVAVEKCKSFRPK